jgi:hypothetical protein
MSQPAGRVLPIISRTMYASSSSWKSSKRSLTALAITPFSISWNLPPTEYMNSRFCKDTSQKSF